MKIILPLGILGAASMFFGSLILQHAFGFQPCAWCIIQRCAALLALIGLVFAYISKDDLITKLWNRLGYAGLLAGIGAAAYQTYMSYKANEVCGDWLGMKLGFFTMDYPLTAWLLEPTALCSEANTTHFGLFLSEWSLAVFVLVLMVNWLDLNIVFKR